MWALGGRNKAKMEQLRKELSEEIDPTLNAVPILVGDISDQSSIDAIMGQARVVIATAGPFRRHGASIVSHSKPLAILRHSMVKCLPVTLEAELAGG